MSSTFGYYPGCSLKGTGKEYDISIHAVAEILSHELVEIPDWLCCGATSAHSINHALATALAGDTLAKAQDAGQDKILAPCAMCYSRLATVTQQIQNDPKLAAKLEAALKREKSGLADIKALSVLDWLRDIPREELTAPIKKSFKDFKFACYYGCLLVRPQKVTHVENAEVPQDMERVLDTMGIQTVKWNMATACCGASFSLSDKPTVFRLSKKIIDDARKAGANAIVVGCPMCHTNLDMRQTEFQPAEEQIPVLYITQLMGLAYGIEPEKLGLNAHFVSTEPITAALEAAAQ